MATAKKQIHEGFANYETWCINLWINNEEPLRRYWREAAGRAMQRCSKQTAVIALANRLKDELTERAPDLGHSCWSDLLTAALSEVDWDEIAEDLIVSRGQS